MRNLVVIPAYNEEAALARTVQRLDSLPEPYELLIVNDGSTDRTGFIADNLARLAARRIHVVHLPMNCGIGVAVQTGYLFATKAGGYRYVIQFDGDGQHDARYVEQMVQACEERQLDLCLGSRFLSGSTHSDRSTWTRRLGIHFFARLISLLSGTAVTDPTSGFRCAGPRAWSRFAGRYPEDYPEPESLFWLLRNRLRIGEIPVRMHRRQGGVSSIRSLRSVYYMLKVSLAILFDWARARERLER
ncbi:MAG TPA: glycosyltransferase family 2 protein [Gemmataceae bacterium]|nr:glycosyltransferase family 2 protein [Gemmataceae bacterium]